MTSGVRESYDAMAELYASLFLRDLDHDEYATGWLARFADHAAAHDGPVLDLGCGPGHVVDHLHRLGLNVAGLDLSPGQIEQARAAFPELGFSVGDLTRLEQDDGSVGGISSRYSLIHLSPDRLDAVFREWRRVLAVGAPVLVTFFGALTTEGHGEAFDHKVVTAYALHPPTIAELVADAGFEAVEVDTRPPHEGGRPYDQATVFAI